MSLALGQIIQHLPQHLDEVVINLELYSLKNRVFALSNEDLHHERTYGRAPLLPLLWVEPKNSPKLPRSSRVPLTRQGLTSLNALPSLK